MQIKQKDPLISKLVGIIPNDGKDSVEEVRQIRKKLSEQCRNMSYEEFMEFIKTS